MFVYRLSKTKYIYDLSGTGAKQYGGRWNEKGTPLIYTSGSIALCVLESLVHYSVQLAPKDMSLAVINIPDPISKTIIEIESLGQLPVNWREHPPTLQTQQFINKWIKEKSSLMLKVPSVIIPSECNYLINPLHDDIKLLLIESTSVFSFDTRLV